MGLKITRKQDEMLTRLLVQLCELYNMALQQRIDVWKSHRTSLTLYDQQKQLTELRAGIEEYAQSPLKVQRDPLRRLDRAFKDFFRRCKSGENPGFPRFRSPKRYNSFTVDCERSYYRKGELQIVKLGKFRAKTRCKIKGKLKEIHVKRCGQKWQAQIVCDIGPAPEKIAVRNAVGIDLGITSLVTLSDGTEISNPRWTKKEEKNLAEANRDLARKQKGSNNLKKSKERLRRVHQHIMGLRHSYLISVAKEIVSKYDLIVHEDLTIRNMARSNYAKQILDAAWGKLIRRLNCEAEYAGKWVIPVNPRGTTQRCSSCGEKVPKERRNRIHNCPNCGLVLGRDLNAALNILRLGEGLVATQNA
jgi:putative transposase